MAELWDQQNAVATTNLVKAFEKLNPNISIKILAQPGTSYFNLLQTSAISGTGPDSRSCGPVSTTLVRQRPREPEGQRAAADLARWRACSGRLLTSTRARRLRNAAGDPVLHRLLQQGAVQKAASLQCRPTGASSLADCKALKAKGIQPSSTQRCQAISTEFYPWYDMSYLMIGAHSLTSWKGLYDGSIPWTSSANVTS